MARVYDLWTKKNPDKSDGAPKRIRTARWGIGKRWQARWHEDGTRRSEMFTTRDEAELFVSNVVVGQHAGTWINKDKKYITLGDLWEPWYASKRGIAERTQRDYLSVWTTHIKPVWGHRACGDVTNAAVKAWLPTLTTDKGVKAGADPRPLGESQMHKIAVIMKGILDLAVEQNIIPKNPVKTSAAPKPKKAERRYLRVHEVDALLSAMPTDEARLLLRVLFMTGLRPGEAKGLKVKDLDYFRGRLLIRRDVDDLGRVDATKTRDHRDVPISPTMANELAVSSEGKDPEAWLIPDERGKVWTTSRWRVVWKNALIYTGLEGLDTYELRHTAASLAIAAGADVKTVQLMLGHSSAAMTLDVYAHLWEEGLDTIPAAMESHMDAAREAHAIKERAKANATAEARRAQFKVL